MPGVGAGINEWESAFEYSASVAGVAVIRPLIRRLAIGFFLLNLLAVTWPGATLFRSAEPLVLGLPLSMAWPIAWILMGWIVLMLLDYFENREQR